jgi:hypothetical protein
MTKLVEIYERILNTISDFHPDIIYLAIGCSLAHYTKVEDDNNQQNPPFMNKYMDSKKVTILIDPWLEDKLAISQMIPLNLIDEFESYRYFLNSDKNHQIHAIKNYFYFAKNEYDVNSHSQYQYDYNFLINLINYAVVNKKTKLIVQDYSGVDIIPHYLHFTDHFPKQILYEKVIFDITQKDGGCFIDFSKYPIRYDSKDNFIQPRFLPLSIIKNITGNINKSMATSRFNNITCDFSRKIRVLRGELESHPHNEYHFKQALKLYSIIYDSNEDIENPTIEILKDTIIKMLLDICELLEIPTNVIVEIEKNDFKQKNITEILSPIRILINEIPE